MRGDLKHLRCPVCKELVKSLHATVGGLPKTMKARKNKPARPSEEAVAKVVQKACSPSSEAGAWLKTFDVVESGGTLALSAMGSAGKCRRECRTMMTSCEETMDALDSDDLQVKLWMGAPVSEITEAACEEWTSACDPKKLKRLGEVPEREDEAWMDLQGNEGATPSGFTNAGTSGAASFLEQILGGFGRWLSDLSRMAYKEASKVLTYDKVAREAGKMKKWYLETYQWCTAKNLERRYGYYKREAQTIYRNVWSTLEKANKKSRVAADKAGYGMLFTAFVILSIAATEVLISLGGAIFLKLVPEDGAVDRALGWLILLLGNLVTVGAFAYISLKGKYF